MKAVAKTTAMAKKMGASQEKTAVAVMKAVVKETAKKEGQAAAAEVVKELEDSVQGKQKICGPSEDEIFDNCVKASEKLDEEEDDSNSIAQTDSTSDSREYGSAAMNLVNEITEKLEEQNADTAEKDNAKHANIYKAANIVAKNSREQSQKKMDQLTAQSIRVLQNQSSTSELNMENAINTLNAAQEKKEARSETLAKIEAAKRIANEEVKKTQSKAVQVVKNAVTKQESANGGIIDMVTKTLAHHAQIQKERDDTRTKMETEIMTRVAATDSKIKATRSSLHAGLTATKDLTPAQSKKSLEAAAAVANEESQKKSK